MSVIASTLVSGTYPLFLSEFGDIEFAAHPLSIDLEDDAGIPRDEILNSQQLSVEITAGNLTLDIDGTIITAANVADLELTLEKLVTIAVDGVSEDALSIGSDQILTANVATASTDGLLAQADKTKLDTVETNAAADQSATEVPYSNGASGLAATDVQAAIDEVDGRIDSLELIDHAPVTLNAGAVTLDSANLIGQELELVAATSSTSGVMTSVAQTFGGVKTFAADQIEIDAPSATGTMEFGFFTDVSPNCYGMRNTSGSGYFCWASNSDNPQWILGSPTMTGTSFIDSENSRPLNLNTLNTGPGNPGLVSVGAGGFEVQGTGNINLVGGNITLAASATVDGIDVSSPINSIEVSASAYQLVNDVASPAGDAYYGTNTAGTKGWHALPPNSIAVVRTNGGSDNTINYNTVGNSTVTFSTVTQVDSDFSWSVANDQFTVNFTGWVQAHYQFPTTSTGTRNSIHARILQQGGVTAEHGHSITYIRNGSRHTRDDALGTAMIQVTSGDTLEVIVDRDGSNGNATNVTETAEFFLRRVQ